MKKVFGALAAILVLGLVSGCTASKDYSKEEIKPIGTPNPNLPVVSPGGASGAGAPAAGATGAKSATAAETK